MLFNSFSFILAFLPLALLVFYQASKISLQLAFIALTALSFLFYAADSGLYVSVLAGSILFNYVCENAIRQSNRVAHPPFKPLPLLVFGLTGNIVLLGYFKYANFIIHNINIISGLQIADANITLPPGISFFTFVQVAFLVDAYKGLTKENDLIGYSLFVSFFPHLIAGPIIHISDMMPQFRNYTKSKLGYEQLAVGLSIFTVGLAKKVLIADPLAVEVNAAFAVAGKEILLSPLDAWGSTIGYTLQIYYDFSGYSDMATGLAYMFGIKFPANFNSPYKATSIIDFWRRWHMTLSTFLRDYVYIPLGGGKGTKIQRTKNLMLTMLIGGLWHGAGWNFVFWGAIHGVLLVAAHSFRQYWPLSNKFNWLTIPITLLCVHFAWIPFRAENMEVAQRIFGALWSEQGTTSIYTWPLMRKILAVLIGTLILPNTQEIFRFHYNRFESHSTALTLPWITWKPTIHCASIIGLLLSLCMLSLNSPSTFIYFRF